MGKKEQEKFDDAFDNWADNGELSDVEKALLLARGWSEEDLEPEDLTKLKPEEKEETGEVDMLGDSMDYDKWLQRGEPSMGKSNSKGTSSIGFGTTQRSPGYSYTMKCRHRAELVFEIGTVSYYAASGQHADEFVNGVRIDLTTNKVDADWKNAMSAKPIPGGLVQTVPGFLEIIMKHELVVPTPAPVVVAIDWDDYGAPPVKHTFWKALHTALKKQKITHVQVNCVGGHGRTGTFMAAMLIAVCKDSAKDAIDFVRDKYCKEAIEGNEQKDYLYTLAKTVKV